MIMSEWTDIEIEQMPKTFARLPLEVQAEICERNAERNPLREMARVGNVGDFSICIYDGEGPIPHFHITNRKTGQKGCIRLEINGYFNHGSKQMTLNTNERRELCKFLNARTMTSALTNYQAICLMWNTNNPDYRIHGDPKNLKMPDYRNM